MNKRKFITRFKLLSCTMVLVILISTISVYSSAASDVSSAPDMSMAIVEKLADGIRQQELEERGPMCSAVRSMDSVAVGWQLKNNTHLAVLFSKGGANSITGISAVYLLDSEEKDEKSIFNAWKTTRPFMTSYTDWVGPYVVKSLNTGHGDSEMFTGGWHAESRPSGDGRSPTARMISFTATGDGAELQDGCLEQYSSVELTVVNEIKAYNTIHMAWPEAAVLQETVTYTISAGKIDVSVRIKAPNDAVISRYYGLQTVDSAWQGTVSYPNGFRTSYSLGINSMSGNSSDFPRADQILIEAPGAPCDLNAWIDKNVGLGRMEYLAGYFPCAFTENYGGNSGSYNAKSYFYLVGGKPCTLLNGQEVDWSGGYRFIPHN